MDMVRDVLTYLEAYPWAETLIGVAAVALAATVANFITKRILLGILRRILAATLENDQTPLVMDGVIGRLANIVPALVVYAGVEGVPHVGEAMTALVQRVCVAFIVLMLAMAVAAALNLANSVYQRRPDAGTRPIKGYLQVVSIVIYCAAAVLMVAALMDRSPLLLLSGLGALAAVLMLVFKDTILSLVASVQLTSNDMLRVGDWIEMPSAGADGDVIDIALHTVKVQNFDKTIVTIPTWKLINESFRNWRGMAQAGGRRIKRPLLIDQNSVGFLRDGEVENLRRFSVLGDYLDEKDKELREWNAALEADGKPPVNMRRQTNIGAFRAYIVAYLKGREDVSDILTLMARQLEPTPQGLPLEVYCFAATTAWKDYEYIQSDIFDHLIAILPEFGLRLFQAPAGSDLVALRPAEASGAAGPEQEAEHPPVARAGGI